MLRKYINTNDACNFQESPSFFSLEKSEQAKIKSSAKLQHCTCCVIKPHAVQAGLIAPIIVDIQKAKFVISAIQQFCLDPVNAEEFLEVYKGVLPDYAVNYLHLFCLFL